MASHHGADALTLDHMHKDAVLHGRRLALTPREFLILAALAEKPHHLVSYEQLIQTMWGSTSVDDRHAIEVYVSRLRRKLGETGVDAQIIRTVRGRGYIFEPPDVASRSVRFTYDRNLILRKVEPDDRPFIGWSPEDVIGTFFMLTSVTRIHSSRRVALAVARLWAALGLREWNGPISVRRADGSLTYVTADFRVLTSGGRFRGMEATIHL